MARTTLFSGRGLPHAVMRFVLAASTGLTACEDPARPVPPGAGAVLSVDSEPTGGTVILDGAPTGEVTPAVFRELTEGVHSVVVELDTAGIVYDYGALVVLPAAGARSVSQPLTVGCTTPLCLRDAAQFHSTGNVRFAVNGAGPLFLYDGGDLGIVWPALTPNSHASIGGATLAARVDGEPVALALRNAGMARPYWSGRPVPRVTSLAPYTVSVPAWIVPSPASRATIRGLEVVHEAIVDPAFPNAILVRATVRNISADSLYRQLDPDVPDGGVTYTDAYVGFILDADVGPFTEAVEDLVSYSAGRGLVFAYDGDMAVTGFTGGWSTRPGLIGLMLLDGPGGAVRLNAWPRASDFLSGIDEADGFALLTAQQLFLPDHPDARIGYAPFSERADYTISVASGPATLAPGEQLSARFAVLLAEPVAGTFESGEVLPAGNPEDPNRAVAAAAAGLFALADSLIATPPAPAND